jgi:hypothetical protein
LDGLHKLAVSLLFLKSVLFTAFVNIIFVYYGDILFNKYNIGEKYPNIGKIIKLRQKYTKYYFILNCLLIFGVILVEVVFSICIPSIFYI